MEGEANGKTAATPRFIKTSSKVEVDLDAAKGFAARQITALEAMTERWGEGKVVEPVAMSEPHARLMHGKLHGLVQAMSVAYNQHLVLKLRPDDIWLVIAQGVATHINANAEAFRSKFVAHEGKEELVAYQDPPPNWPLFVEQLVAQIEEKVLDKTLPVLLQCGFSTSTPAIRAASRIVIMKSMEAYFNYTCCTCCGIPAVIMEGTLEDWQCILAKVQQLQGMDLDLDWWLDDLKPVLQQLVNTYQGQPSEEFWSTIIRHNSYGSGPGDYTGWVCTLFPYTPKSKRRVPVTAAIKDDGVPESIQAVAFKLIDIDGGIFDREFRAGYLGCQVDEVQGSVAPVIGWLVTHTVQERKEYEAEEFKKIYKDHPFFKDHPKFG